MAEFKNREEYEAWKASKVKASSVDGNLARTKAVTLVVIFGSLILYFVYKVSMLGISSLALGIFGIFLKSPIKIKVYGLMFILLALFMRSEVQDFYRHTNSTQTKSTQTNRLSSAEIEEINRGLEESQRNRDEEPMRNAWNHCRNFMGKSREQCIDELSRDWVDFRKYSWAY